MRSSLSWEVPTSSLTAVAWQIAYAIENTQLIARKAEEERLRCELQAAHDMQMGLMPKELFSKASTSQEFVFRRMK